MSTPLKEENEMYCLLVKLNWSLVKDNQTDDARIIHNYEDRIKNEIEDGSHPIKINHLKFLALNKKYGLCNLGDEMNVVMRGSAAKRLQFIRGERLIREYNDLYYNKRQKMDN